MKKISLFTVEGKEISSFKDISSSCKVIIVSLDGTFQGLRNTLRSENIQKQRILQEESTRGIFDDIRKKFTMKVKAASDKELSQGKIMGNMDRLE